MFCRKFDSCRILKILSNSQNPIEFSKSNRILKILSNILYPIEYSYGSSEDSMIYLTFYSLLDILHITAECQPWKKSQLIVVGGWLHVVAKTEQHKMRKKRNEKSVKTKGRSAKNKIKKSWKGPSSN